MKKQEIIYVELERHTLHQLSVRRMTMHYLHTLQIFLDDNLTYPVVSKVKKGDKQ
jgi:hypothetical protein